MADTAKTRPGAMRLIDVTQTACRSPAWCRSCTAPAALMFVLLPFVVWLFDASVTSDQLRPLRQHSSPASAVAPAWFVKLVVLALIWAFLHHPVRRRAPRLDGRDAHSVISKGTGPPVGRDLTLAASLVLALLTLLGARLFGLY